MNAALLAQLEEEASMGWPAPWHPQDRVAALAWDHTYDAVALDTYIGLLADAHTEARKDYVAPSKQTHLKRVA